MGSEKEGRKAGMGSEKERRKEGRKERRKEGRKEGTSSYTHTPDGAAPSGGHEDDGRVGGVGVGV